MSNKETPESITVSLDRAKKLKEAGWPHGTPSFYWRGENLLYKNEAKSVLKEFPLIAAPTAEEILRRLPKRLETKVDALNRRAHLLIRPSVQNENRWTVTYRYVSMTAIEDTLANAVAAMWCYLKKNNLLPSDA